MAELRDADGRKVVIDDPKVEVHIRVLETARGKLEAIQQELNPEKLDNSLMDGDMRVVVVQKLDETRKKMPALLKECDDVLRGIQQTVEKYKRIDKEAAEKIAGR